MAELETFVRQVEQTAAPRRIATDQFKEVARVTLQIGRGGSGRQFSGSRSHSQSFYCEAHRNEPEAAEGGASTFRMAARAVSDSPEGEGIYHTHRVTHVRRFFAIDQKTEEKDTEVWVDVQRIDEIQLRLAPDGQKYTYHPKWHDKDGQENPNRILVKVKNPDNNEQFVEVPSMEETDWGVSPYLALREFAKPEVNGPEVSAAIFNDKWWTGQLETLHFYIPSEEKSEDASRRDVDFRKVIHRDIEAEPDEDGFFEDGAYILVLDEDGGEKFKDEEQYVNFAFPLRLIFRDTPQRLYQINYFNLKQKYLLKFFEPMDPKDAKDEEKKPVWLDPFQNIINVQWGFAYLYSGNDGVWGSGDGEKWTEKPEPVPVMSRLIAYGDNTWVGRDAGIDTKIVWRSTNGKDWEAISTPGGATFDHVAYMKTAKMEEDEENGIFAGLTYNADSGETEIHVSTDLGLTWSLSRTFPNEDGVDAWFDYSLTGCGERLFFTRELYRGLPAPESSLRPFVRIHSFNGSSWSESDVLESYPFDLWGDLPEDLSTRFSVNPGGVGFDKKTGTYGLAAAPQGDIDAIVYATSSNGTDWGSYTEVMRSTPAPFGISRGLGVSDSAAGGNGLLLTGVLKEESSGGTATYTTWVLDMLSGAFTELAVGEDRGLGTMVFHKTKGFATILGAATVLHRDPESGVWTPTHSGSAPVSGAGRAGLGVRANFTAEPEATP